MLRLFVSASIFVIVLGLAGLPARAQSSSDATSKSLRVAQTISPTQQEEQRAAKSVACRKQAKEQKLSGSERGAFLKDCIRKDDGAEAAKLSDAKKVALEKAMAACKVIVVSAAAATLAACAVTAVPLAVAPDAEFARGCWIARTPPGIVETLRLLPDAHAPNFYTGTQLRYEQDRTVIVAT